MVMIALSAEDNYCTRCFGIGFIPDGCSECGAWFDPQIELSGPKLPCGHSSTLKIPFQSCSHCKGTGQEPDSILDRQLIA